MSEQPTTGEYHRADPAYRRQMKVCLVLVLISGGLALVALHFWLSRLDAVALHGDLSSYQSWLQRLLAGLCLLLGVAAAGFAHWLHRMALATRAERRWPPSSMRTSADMRVRYLTSADLLVSQLKGSALALAALAVILGGWAFWLLWSS